MHVVEVYTMKWTTSRSKVKKVVWWNVHTNKGKMKWGIYYGWVYEWDILLQNENNSNKKTTTTTTTNDNIMK